MIQIKHDSIRFFFLSHIKSIHPKVISTKLNKSADLKKVCWEASRAAPWIVEAICFKHFSKIRLYAWWKNCPGLWVCVCVRVCVLLQVHGLRQKETSCWALVPRKCSSTLWVTMQKVLWYLCWHCRWKNYNIHLEHHGLMPREVHMDTVLWEGSPFLQHREEVGWWIQTWQREVLEDYPVVEGWSLSSHRRQLTRSPTRKTQQCIATELGISQDKVISWLAP